ncbi:MAG: ParB/RepB/Spo0J family partition protein [Actinomycetota bacterium]
MSKRGGLGRGLGALIPGASDQPSAPPAQAAGVPLEIPVGDVAANPQQPRTVFEEEPLESLAASIREVGVLQPIVVRRKSSGGYELIAGERRLRAAKRAGLATIPAVIRESDEKESLREALIENIHREDLNPIELAESFHTLLGELEVTQDVLAARLGMSRSHIANTIRLLQLPGEVQRMLTDGRLQAGHARALLALGDAGAQTSLALRTAAEGLSVREVEDAVRVFIDPPTRATGATTGATTKPGGVQEATRDGSLGELEEILSEQLATRVAIQMSKQRGRILIDFGSADDLERIVSEIIGSGPGLAPE